LLSGISAADILRAAADGIRHESGALSGWPDQTVARAIAQVERVFSDAARSHQSCGPYRLANAHQRRV